MYASLNRGKCADRSNLLKATSRRALLNKWVSSILSTCQKEEPKILFEITTFSFSKMHNIRSASTIGTDGILQEIILGDLSFPQYNTLASVSCLVYDKVRFVCTVYLTGFTLSSAFILSSYYDVRFRYIMM